MASVDLKSRTVSSRLKHWASTDHHTPAFIFTDAEWNRCVLTRADLFRLSSKYAAILRRSGVEKGAVVVNTLVNSPHRLITDLAVLLCGAVAMNGQVFLADGEDFVGSLKQAEAVAVILDSRQPKGAVTVLRHLAHTQQGSEISYPDLPALKRVFDVHLNPQDNEKRFLQATDEEENMYVADVAPTDAAVIMTTSGSSGFSKLVPRSHEAVLVVGGYFCQYVDPYPGDKYYNDRPLGWIGGFPTIYLTHGNTRVLLDHSKGLPEDPVSFQWRVICREQCSVALIVPSQLLHLIDVCGREGAHTHRMRSISTGGQPLKKKHMAAIGKLTDVIRVGYGSTECGFISVKVVTDKDQYEDCNNGTPIREMRVRVVDTEHHDVAPGQLGQIVVKGPQIMDKYVNNSAATHNAFTKEGWFQTGDVGHFNDQGELFTICRQAFSIMRGSYLVYPGWLESRIGHCPGVKDVMVVPVPDPVLHQELCVCVVPLPDATLTPQGLRDYCSSLFLTSDQSEMTAIPKYYLFWDRLPTTSTGKTCRRSSTVLARKQLGLQDHLLPRN